MFLNPKIKFLLVSGYDIERFPKLTKGFGYFNFTVECYLTR